MPLPCSKRRGRRAKANVASIEAKRNFWLASTDLSVAVLGGGGVTAEPPGSVLALSSGTGAPASIRTRTTAMLSRRKFLGGSAVALASVAAIGSRSEAAAIPEAPTTESAAMQPPIAPQGGQDYQPVVTLERLDAALAHERGMEGVPSRRRAGARANSRPA